jgi:hypothetical protein
MYLKTKVGSLHIRALVVVVADVDVDVVVDRKRFVVKL